MLGEEGIEQEVYGYDEFGQETTNINYSRSNSQNIMQPFTFTGYQRDGVANTYYAQAREYSPQIARMISEDPIYSGKNWYTYCDNNPVNFIDLLGLEASCSSDTDNREKLFTDNCAIPKGKADIFDHLIDWSMGLFGVEGGYVKAAEGPNSDLYKVSSSFYNGIQMDNYYFTLNYTQSLYDTMQWAAQQDAITASLKPSITPNTGYISLNDNKAVVIGEGMKDIKFVAKQLQSEGIDAKWHQTWSKNFPANR